MSEASEALYRVDLVEKQQIRLIKAITKIVEAIGESEPEVQQAMLRQALEELIAP